nr:uncharacterized protein CTRU02_07594 [Colletotrichum truncatum]KAF6791254.1 hypothetical protein CTRU02_07594 [Colletotrichum truncatum]
MKESFLLYSWVQFFFPGGICEGGVHLKLNLNLCQAIGDCSRLQQGLGRFSWHLSPRPRSYTRSLHETAPAHLHLAVLFKALVLRLSAHGHCQANMGSAKESYVRYYILVVVCVVARKAKWMRAVSLAAALLVPAVAAIHGIILASLHVDGELQETQLEAKKLKPSATGATDMDIYGALQFCSIGILAAPVTVKLSSTFFFDPGRNIIFLWTGLILSGLLSLAVEFYRSNTTACTHDDAGNPIPTSSGSFPYGGDAMCNLTCSQDDGPLSYLRLGAASEIYVVPKPTKLPFGMAMFLAAAECVPAILSLVTMWNKILEINWKARRGGGSQEKEQPNKLIPGANGATFGGMRDVNQAIRSLLSAIEVPVFAGAWLAVLIIGEINFWSPQVNYHTEPIGSIGTYHDAFSGTELT